ncbi:hypothetical protein HHK36_008481 [Tetracentron sinense]|uniref:Glycosyltransferase n=1 Tax=Tetracentron sinense TaxID=13715 RepID=A0A834ZFI7_TETSI|nr:hypothetical protein HHK36_008481 [Tetracentron sinense]
MESPKPHIALLSSPGLGHLIPILELGKRLLSLHGFHITIFVTTTQASTAQSQLLNSQTVPGKLTIVELPPADISSLVRPDTAIEITICIIVRESIPALQSAILAMTQQPTVLIVDIFGIDAFEIADQFQIPKYVFITSSAIFLALTVYVPTLDGLVVGEYVDLQEPIRVPGCNPIRPDDVVDPMLDRKHERYSVYVDICFRLLMAHGLFLNTWEDLEPITIRALREDIVTFTPPIYPIGPLMRSVGPPIAGRECLDWLDMQRTESVLYVSFGSGGTISAEQLTELATGLELSQQRFIWVVRAPTKKDASATFFTSGNGHDDLSEYFPDGFLTRTREVGLMVPQWAPQVEILSHPSIGGFLSHCGWNSTIESIMNGVPMIAWPLYAEQRMNASILTEDLNVAVRPEILPAKGVVGRKEIERMVRRVMEGEEGNELRGRVRELRSSALKSLNEGGSSYNSLSQVARKWEMSDKNMRS